MAKSLEPVHSVRGSLALAVRHYVDGDVTVDVWEGPADSSTDFETVFDGPIDLDGGDLMLTDTLNRVRLTFPVDDSVRIVVRAQGLPHVDHVVVEMHTA